MRETSLPAEKVCAPCRSLRGVDRAVFRVMQGISLCGGCVADMPTWCATCLRKQPQQFSRAVAFRDDRHYCKPCLEERYPPPARPLPVAEAPRPVDPVAVVKEIPAEGVVEKPKQEERMTKDIDWAQVQKERDAGVPVSTLKEKYGCSDASIYTKTKAPNKLERKTRATPPKKGKSVEVDSESPLAGAIADLRARRDKLTAAIEQLEAIEL